MHPLCWDARKVYEFLQREMDQIDTLCEFPRAEFAEALHKTFETGVCRTLKPMILYNNMSFKSMFVAIASYYSSQAFQKDFLTSITKWETQFPYLISHVYLTRVKYFEKVAGFYYANESRKVRSC
jgi:hypothetical protein